MCGRFTLAVDSDILQEYFELKDEVFEHQPRYNIAPGQQVPVIGMDKRGEKGLAHMQWGFIPHWAKDPSSAYKMINARAETVNEKPAFRHAFYKCRCLIPADSFFEWKKENNKKQPVRIYLPGYRVFAFAALWSLWQSEKENIYTCAIVTTGANDFMKDIHDRMPVILADKEAQDNWLTSEDKSVLKNLLQPYPGEIDSYSVPFAVNSPRNDNPECIKKID